MDGMEEEGGGAAFDGVDGVEEEGGWAMRGEESGVAVESPAWRIIWMLWRWSAQPDSM